ncbi:MAG: ECF transporter S component [Defluviitaleaceae bacterium]|nr:ECF transporter S component [Defluviitaleaceae bacterium]
MAKARRSLLAGFTILDLVVITVLSALGVAVGGIVGLLVRFVTGPLMIPGGAVAGGIYFMFLVLAVALTGKKSAAVLVGALQAIMVIVMPWAGNHGIATILTYTAPGVAIFLFLLIMRHNGCCKLCCFFAVMVANLTGVALVSGVVMQLPLVPMLLGLTLGALSGGLGGLLTWSLAKQLKKLEVIK